jgi:hypothetical protein
VNFSGEVQILSGSRDKVIHVTVNVQLDLVEPGQESGGSAAIWNGQYAELPAVGAVIELRSTAGGGPGVYYLGPAPRGESEFYVVIGHQWICFAAPATSLCMTAIVYVRRATSKDTQWRLQLETSESD